MKLSEFQTVSFSAGEKIYREGEQGDSAYVIISGEVLVHKKKGTKVLELAKLGPNQMIGEMVLISPGHRTASVTAKTDCSLLLIEQSQFTRRRSDLDPVMKMVFDVILMRFRTTLNSIGNESQGVPVSPYVTGEMQKAIEQLRLETDIRRALANDEFELHYQPVVCLKSGKLAGAEGLMRWNHPTRGLLPPSEFIPTAEAGNLILKLTEAALDQACRDSQHFSVKALKNVENVAPMFTTLNVSARDLDNDRFYDHVYFNLLEYSMPRGSLKIEVTETSLMSDFDACSERLAYLRSKGVGIAIDDFGTGYSSMSYLAKLPLSTLKIDRTFTSEMLEKPQSQKIVNAILKLAKELDLTVVAEGIENASDAAYLRCQECEYGQGFLFSKALPLEEFLMMIENWDQNQPFIQEEVGLKAASS